MVLKDFLCKQCGEFEKLVAADAATTRCSDCGFTAQRVFLQSAPIVGEVRNSFNPHYDLQLGQHFASAEQKDNFLKKTGRIQYSGASSPRKDSNTMFRCSREQAKKEFGIAPVTKLPRVTNEELK